MGVVRMKSPHEENIEATYHSVLGAWGDVLVGEDDLSFLR